MISGGLSCRLLKWRDTCCDVDCRRAPRRLVDQKQVHKSKQAAAQAGKGSFAWAWLLDERPEERARGVTVDVAVSHFETSHRAVTLLETALEKSRCI